MESKPVTSCNLRAHQRNRNIAPYDKGTFASPPFSWPGSGLAGLMGEPPLDSDSDYRGGTHRTCRPAAAVGT